MSKKIFNRKDLQVKKDAINLPKESFITKYTSDTTADETVLTTVWDSFAKDRAAADTIDQTASTATDLVEQTSYVSEDGDKVKISKNKKTGATVAEVSTPVENLPEGDNAAEGKESETKKPGRTPRMRELIKQIGKDKQLVKKALTEEGFDCSGSGFHSEWNRVSKQ